MYNRRMPDATPTPTEEEAEAAALQLKNISNLRSADEEKKRDLRESMPIFMPPSTAPLAACYILSTVQHLTSSPAIYQ